MTDKQTLATIIEQGKNDKAELTAEAVIADGWVKTTVIQSLEELKNLPAYVTVRFDIVGTNSWLSGCLLGHKSPNGLWWSTQKLPDTAEELWEICNGKATAYWDGLDSTEDRLDH